MLTPRENVLLALEHKAPERIVDLRRDCNMLAGHIIMEKLPYTPESPTGTTGVD